MIYAEQDGCRNLNAGVKTVGIHPIFVKSYDCKISNEQISAKGEVCSFD
jgi:hypothetical protein